MKIGTIRHLRSAILNQLHAFRYPYKSRQSQKKSFFFLYVHAKNQKKAASSEIPREINPPSAMTLS